MSDVFISYKAEDRRRIQPLVKNLQADGFTVWWDQHIGTGDDWRETIERELDAAKCVIVIWSKRSVGPEGQFVRDEAARAQQRRVYVPVTIDDVRIPLGFGESQATSLRGWRGSQSDQRYQVILTAVRRIVGNPAASSSAHRGVSVDRRALLVGGGVATAAIVGLGFWSFLHRGASGAAASIAVLPFANLSGDPARAFFADGIAGEIRSTLTRIEGLKVAGSTSSAAVRDADAQDAASKLGVANILTGSVRETPSTIRVTAELIDGRTGLAKWSQNYDRAPGDVIKIQSDIAENVAGALAIALSPSARKALAAGETSNIAAQQLVFQARDLSWQLTVPALRQSMMLVDKAIAIDPGYARAYAMKSFVLNNLVSQTARTPKEMAAGRSEALQYAKKALSLAPKLPLARSALGFAYSHNLQIGDAVREQTIALSLASGDPDVIRNYGLTISSVGRSDEALRRVDEALALDPLNWASHWAHASVLFEARRYEEAVRYSLKIQRDSPDLFRFSELLGHSLLMLGREKEAADAFGESIIGQALVAARSGNRGLAIMKLAELRKREGEFGAFDYARITAQLGDKQATFQSLEHAWRIRAGQLADLKVDPYLDPIRSDPRYAALLNKMGFPT